MNSNQYYSNTEIPFELKRGFFGERYDGKNLTADKISISARNQLRGVVVDVQEGAVNSKVVVDVGCGNFITSIITMASLKDLKIVKGSKVIAIIKSSDVILGV